MGCVVAGLFLLICPIAVIIICCVFVRGANKSNRHVSNRNVYVSSGPATAPTPVSSSKQYKNAYPLQPTTASAPPQPVAYPSGHPAPYPTDPTLSQQAPPPYNPDGYKEP